MARLAPVLNADDDVTSVRKGSGERPNVNAVVGRAPEAAVDEEDDARQASFAFRWEVHVRDLIAVRAVLPILVGWTIGGHEWSIAIDLHWRAMIDLVYPEQQAGLAWWPVAVVIVTLIVLNVVNNRVAPQTHYLLWSFGGSAGLLALGLLDGNSWTDMGLSVTYLLPGLIGAAICIGGVTAVYLVGSAFKRTRAAFHDERMSELTGSRLMFQALVEVPFGTVLLEEIAFRAVLFSMLARRCGLVWGIVISAVLFGLWHVLPSIGTHEQNPALGSVVGQGRRGNILAVALSVLTTTIASVIFAGLRIVSGSVLVPMGLHWATNGLGYAFSWLLIRERARRRARHRAEIRRRQQDSREEYGGVE